MTAEDLVPSHKMKETYFCTKTVVIYDVIPVMKLDELPRRLHVLEHDEAFLVLSLNEEDLAKLFEVVQELLDSAKFPDSHLFVLHFIEDEVYPVPLNWILDRDILTLDYTVRPFHL